MIDTRVIGLPIDVITLGTWWPGFDFDFESAGAAYTAAGGATPNNDTGTTGFYIGRREGSNGFHNGHIAEILAYSGVMSDADCLRIERYLAAKYWPLMA